MRRRKQHKPELPGLRQRRGDLARIPHLRAGDPRQRVEHCDLEKQQSECDAGDLDRLGHQHRQGQARPDGDEKQTEQQPPERLDIRLQLMAELGVCQHHPGDERAQRHRQADRGHERCRADNNEQRRRGQQLPHTAGDNEIEQPWQAIAPDEYHPADSTKRHQPGLPAGRSIRGWCACQ